MILMALLVLQIDMLIPAAAISPVNDEAFNAVFCVSIRIIIGSLTAYLVGQLVDIYIFHLIRKKTGGRLLWLRATGSTVISQLVDSFIVLFIPFLGQLSVPQILSIGITNYVYKFGNAVGTTPLLYLIHDMVDRYLGKEVARELMKRAHTEPEGQ